MGADVEAQHRRGGTALTVASRFGHDGIVASLLAHSANVEGLSMEGVTPLMVSARNGHEGIVRKLLEAGADHKATESKTGFNALMYAAKEGSFEVRTLSLGFRFWGFRVWGFGV